MTDLPSQMRRRDVEMVPLALVRAMFGVMAAALLLTAYAVLTDRPHVGTADPSPVAAEAAVRLVPLGGGAVAALDAGGAELARSDEARSGFLAVMGQVVARERLRHGLADDAPVAVRRLADGRVVLFDPATGRTYDLAGHGADNVAAFARLVP